MPRPSSHQLMSEATDLMEKFAIIGAGFSGLSVAGAFKRHSIDFDVLEADDALGGNWYHGVYETAHIISSRKTTQYSDFPIPEAYGDFPSAANMLRYFNAYADHYQLRPHIQLNTEVEYIAPRTEDGYEVRLANGETRQYDGVVIANGHHWDRRMPTYPGIFAGQIIHSKDYKSPAQLQGKRVLVIGGGNSACDIAVEATRFAQSSHISMRRGYWFMPKTMFGIPSVEFIQPWLPIWAQRLFIRTVITIMFGSYERYGLQTPDHRIFEKHPTINSELLYYLKHQRITAHPDIKCYDGHTVEFVDGTRAAFDLIVCATGYHLSIPFLQPGIIEVKGYMPQLIAGLFHPQHKNLYYFGAGQARYGAGPLLTEGAEAMARVVEAQRVMRYPVGAVLQKMGIKPPDNVLIDPHEALRGARLLQRVAPHLPRLECLLMNRPSLPRPAWRVPVLAGLALGAAVMAVSINRRRRTDS